MSLKEIFSLVKATPSEAIEIAALNKQLYLPMKDFRWSTQEWADAEIKEGRYYVLHDKSGVAGAICLHLPYKNIGVIEAIAVRSDLQGQGLGKRMIESAEEVLRKAGMEKVIVNSFHEYGVKDFYQRCGFECVSESPVFNGHSYYSFSKSL
jgi:N-acetylglutamate synthase-like GNAT family acetyltransferase